MKFFLPLLILLLCCKTSLLLAQQEVPDSAFILLRNDSLVTGPEVDAWIKLHLSKSNQNGSNPHAETYKGQVVRYYGDGNNILFAHIGSRFSPCILDRKNTHVFQYSIYSSGRWESNHFPGSTPGSTSRMTGSTYTSPQLLSNYAYNKGLGKYKPFKFRFIKKDMADDPGALKFIKKAQWENTVMWSSVGLGCAGMSLLLFDTNNNNLVLENISASSILTGFVSAFVFSKLKRLHTRKAVKTYLHFDPKTGAFTT